MTHRICHGVLTCLLALLVLPFLTPASHAEESASIQNKCANAPDKIQCEMQFIAENSKFVVRIFNHDGSGSGTGIFFKDRDGLGILTNNHVVAGGFKAWILFFGTEIYQPVEVVGRDEDLDLALLSVPSGMPRDIPWAKLGRSTTLQYGDRVYTAGYPLGQESITAGRVNSLTAAIGHHFFSTQAPVHEGNSGGPLFKINDSGELEVVGINTAIKTSGLLTWSLHIDYVKRTIPKLRKEKVVSHAKAGILPINSREIPPPVYEKMTGGTYPPKKTGVIVAKVEDGSPAATAGIQVGDLITALLYGGKQIPFRSAKELFDIVFFDLLPDTKVVFVTQRGSDTFNREVILGGKKNIPVIIGTPNEYGGRDIP